MRDLDKKDILDGDENIAKAVCCENRADIIFRKLRRCLHDMDILTVLLVFARSPCWKHQKQVL
jgi:hypothetical protein